MQNTREYEDAIAIIGINGRFPGADSVNAFWNNLCSKNESVTFFSDKELRNAGIPEDLLNNPDYVKARPVINKPEEFDWEFFGYTKREAAMIDPQQRILLECAWETLESAGYNPDTYKGWISLYAGCNENTYLPTGNYTDLTSENIKNLSPNEIIERKVTNERDYLATRAGYKMNLKGACVTLQCACSTSLVAIHHACQSLLSYHSDMALAGGVSIEFPRTMGYLSQDGSIFSPDGHCRPFDASANGTIFGEAAGIVLLKRYEDAVNDNDTVLAIIRGSAVNNDGVSKAGFTAPGLDGQMAVIKLAQTAAKVTPDQISFVEAHATGTSVGDPIEFTALNRVFTRNSNKKNFCALGSVKGNIGHTNSASGVVGLIKTVCALKNRKIPPVLHYVLPNPKIDIENSPFFINNTLIDWKSECDTRIAGVSSFGVGGTNAHIIVEEAPVNNFKPDTIVEPQVVILSAKSSSALDTLTENLCQHVNKTSESGLNNIAFTLQIGRRELEYRRAVIAQDCKELNQKIESRNFVSGKVLQAPISIAFMFSGQGSQYPEMTKGIYEKYKIFRDTVDYCSSKLIPILGEDLRSIIYAKNISIDESARLLKLTKYTQPVLFIIEYALTQLWKSWGIQPSVLAGHSIGEFTAACCAEVFSLDDTLSIVAERGALMQSMPEGSMLTVSLSEDELRSKIDNDVSVAAVNAPGLCVISGETSIIEKYEIKFKELKIRCTLLQTSHAFHSSMMRPVAEKLAKKIVSFKPAAPRIRYVSNVHGGWVTVNDVSSEQYWIEHLCCTVRFSDNIKALLNENISVLLELGPGTTLTTLAKHNGIDENKILATASLYGPKSNRTDVENILESAAKLWCSGVNVRWENLANQTECRKISLPTYPFERKQCSVIAENERAVNNEPPRDRRKSDITSWFSVPSWKQSIIDIPVETPVETWLFFTTESDFDLQLINRLQESNQKIIRVLPGYKFEQTGDNEYLVNPDNKEELENFFTLIKTDNLIFDHIIYAWTLNNNALAEFVSNDHDISITANFYSLLFIYQAINSLEFSQIFTFNILTPEMFNVNGTEKINHEISAVLGPCQVFPVESKNINCRVIDFEVDQMNLYSDQLSGILIKDMLFCKDNIVAHRGNKRWVPYEETLQIGPTEKNKLNLKENGVYWITGGLGGIGLEVAAFLAEEYNATIILSSRTVFPDKSKWKEIVSIDSWDETAKKIKHLQYCESIGARVSVVKADITSDADVKNLLQSIEMEYGKLNGIFHTAGVAGNGMAILKSRELSDSVFAPKINFLRIIENILHQKSFDFLLLFSSTFARFGATGQIDYCSANNVMDAFAQKMNCLQKKNVISVGWDGWKNLGMTYRIKKDIDTPEKKEFYRTISSKDEWILSEHMLNGRSAIPGTAYFELIRRVMKINLDTNDIIFKDTKFIKPLTAALGNEVSVGVFINKNADDNQWWSFTVKNEINKNFTDEIVTGKLQINEKSYNDKINLDQFTVKCPQKNKEYDLYSLVNKSGYETWGPHWKCLKFLSTGDNSFFAGYELSEECRNDIEIYPIHPSLLDVATAMVNQFGDSKKMYLPSHYNEIQFHAKMESSMVGYAQQMNASDQSSEITADISLFTTEGICVVTIHGYTLKQINIDALAAVVKEKADNQKVFNGIDIKEGIEALRRILGKLRYPHIIVTPYDLEYRRRKIIETEENIQEKAVDISFWVDNDDKIKNTVSQIWCKYLGIDTIKDDDDFFKLGGHSLLAIQVKDALQKKFGVEIPMTLIFDTKSFVFYYEEVRKRIISKGADLKNCISGQVEETKISGSITKSSDTLSGITLLNRDEENLYTPFELTDVQHAYWIGRINSYEIGNISCHGYFEALLDDHVDVECLENALNKIIKRHDMLHAVIDIDGNQVILKDVPEYKILKNDMSTMSLNDAETQLKEIRQQMSHQVLSAKKSPMMDWRVTTFPDGRRFLHTSTDLLFMDFWSYILLQREIDFYYNNPEKDLPKLEISFRDYLIEERKTKNTLEYKHSLLYWKTRIKHLPPAPELPTVSNATKISKPTFVRRKVIIDRESWRKIKTTAMNHGITASSLVLTVYTEVLEAWSAKKHFTINITIFNRLPLHPQVNDLIGDFTTISLLEVNNSIESEFKNKAKRLQKQLWMDLEHKRVSGIQVLREMAKLSSGKDILMPIVFTSALTQTNSTENENSSLNWMGRENYAISQTPQVWLDNQVTEVDGALVCVWDAVEEIFPAGMLDSMFERYSWLLNELANNEKLWNSSHVQMLSDELLSFRKKINNNIAEIPQGLLHDAIEQKAETTPDAIAVINNNTQISYGTLNNYANIIAHILVKENVQPDTLVAIAMEKGWEQVVAVLAILKAGGAYMPVDPNLPRERFDLILAQGKVSIVLTQNHLLSKINCTSRKLVDLNTELNKDLRVSNNIRPVYQIKNTNLAYVIFTSGSTGVPKGVMIDHRGALNTIVDLNERFNIGADDRVLALSALNFDLSVYDIFGLISAGGTIVIPDVKGVRDPAHWRKLVNDHKITLWNTVPALMEMYAEYITGCKDVIPEHLRLVFMSGDWIPVNLPSKIKKLNSRIELISMGGATEASIWSIIFPIGEVKKEWKSIPYGTPMVNQKMYVLDDKMNPCPDYVTGKIFIGGIGVSLGYWSDPVKTAERFVSHHVTGEKLYWTGDLGKFMPDGNIEFIGREDFQVKIQGFRIELEDIENALIKHDEITRCVVNAVDKDTGGKQLVAYYIPKVKNSINTEELKKFVSRKLPEYMIPKQWVEIDSVPLTNNGKVDRKSLPKPTGYNLSIVPVKTQQVTKTKTVDSAATDMMKDIWKEILGHVSEDTSISFFEDGGDSLLATKIATNIREKFKVEFPLEFIFEHPTLQEMIDYIITIKGPVDVSNQEIKVNYSTLLKVDADKRGEPFPLTDVQYAYWIGRSNRYVLGNVACQGYFESEVTEFNVDAFTSAWKLLIERHEMLRAVVLPNGTQKILPEPSLFPVHIVDMQSMNSEEQNAELIKTREELSHIVLPTDQAPLIRVRVSQLSESLYRIHTNFDLLVVDYWSSGIIIRELGRLYQNPGIVLDPLTISYRDYVLSLKQLEITDTYKAANEYWMTRLTSLPASPSLPIAKNPSEIDVPKFVRRRAKLNSKKWNVLKEGAKKAGVTPSGVVLAAFADVINQWSSDEKFTLNVTLFNRLPVHPQVNDIVGDFTTVNLLEVNLENSAVFIDRAKTIQKQLWTDLNHSSAGGIKVLRELNKLYGGNDVIMPIVFTSALHQTEQDGKDESVEWMGKEIFSISQTPQVWLDCQITETDGELIYLWDVVEELYPAGLMDDMFNGFNALIDMLASDEDSWLISNSNIYNKRQIISYDNVAVADSHGNLMPLWSAGEVYLAGVHSTDVKCIINAEFNKKLYATGITGRFTEESGGVEIFRGKAHDKHTSDEELIKQIKSLLLKREDIKDVDVRIVNNNGKRIETYIVAEEEKGTFNNTPVLLDPIEKLKFKLNKRYLRNELKVDTISLSGFTPDSNLINNVITRRSFRQFCKDTIDFSTFSMFCRELGTVELTDVPLPKHAYGSAGGLYPVQIYIYIKEDRIQNIGGGCFYYNPQQHSLAKIDTCNTIDPYLFAGPNSSIFNQASFAIFLVAEMAAIQPIYGEWSNTFCLLEAGTISHHLEMNAPEHNLGLCQIGMLENFKVKTLFKLNDTHQYLHCLLGGMLPENALSLNVVQKENIVLKEMIKQVETTSNENNLKKSISIEHQNKPVSINISEIEKSIANELGMLKYPLNVIQTEKIPDKNMNVDDDVTVFKKPVVKNMDTKSQNLNNVEDTVDNIWKKILEKEFIDTNSNFFDVGGDSLLVVKIITEIKSIFDVDISVVDFYDCTTISSMSEFVLKNIKQINSDNQINVPVVKIQVDDVSSKLKNDRSKSDEKKEKSRNKLKNLSRQRMAD